MDINEDKIKEEVGSFVSNLQRMLPKRKEIIIVDTKPYRKMVKLTDVHSEAKNVFPKCFVGAKLIILREIMDRVKISQQYDYGKPKEPYKCFTQMLYREMAPKPTRELLLVDTSGSATATYREDLDNGYEMRVISKIKDLFSFETEFVLEKTDDAYCGALSCVMNDVMPKTLRVVSQWMQEVYPEFSVGLEVGLRPLVYPPLPEVSVSARYHVPSFTLSSTVNKYGFQICLFKKFAENLRLAAILNESNRGTTNVGLAVQRTFSNGSELKTFVDSQRCGGVTFQRNIYLHDHQDSRLIRLIFSSLIDNQRRMRFGFGFDIDF